MVTIKTSNKDCRMLVDALEPFKANNLFAENAGSRFYVVYSYGYHWPLWVYDREAREWIGTDSKYSVSTSRHQSLSRPSGSGGCKLFHIEHLKVLVRGVCV